MTLSPTKRSLDLLRKEGYTCAITEHWNPWVNIRQDLFGFIDIVAIKPQSLGILAIQTTSRANVNARINKIKGIPEARTWLITGNRLEVHGWSKMGKVGKRKTWEVFRQSIGPDDLPIGQESL